MEECKHNDRTERRYGVSKKVVKDGQPCTLHGQQIETYCMNRYCLRTINVEYVWDSEPDCPS